MKKYLQHLDTKQIHKLPLTKLCNVKKKSNVRAIGWFEAWWLYCFNRYDFCGHCNRDKSKINS